jgi:Asp-tRNA(Asn)/Glu-tRNA(Gln) amidotransferase C subunit
LHSKALRRKIADYFIFQESCSVQSHLNVDQWVMARDRHRLNRLRKDKKTETAEIEKLIEQSNHKVRQRLARLPKDQTQSRLTCYSICRSFD